MRRSVVVLLSAVVGCAAPAGTDEAPTSSREVSAIERAFSDAAAEYAVPRELLMAIGWVESRWAQRPLERSMLGGYGIMHLIEDGEGGSLARAAELTGHTRDELKRDPVANIRGGAAVLREVADRTFGGTPNLNPQELADWFPVILNLPPTDDPGQAQEYAIDVFSAMARGESRAFEDGTVTLTASPADYERHLLFGSKKGYLTPDYPSAKWNRSPNYTAGRSSYQYVVIHTVQGSYAGCISWFKNTASKVSAHYVIRSSDGEITQMVEHKDTAWHAGCYNNKSIGIEHEGYVSDPKWYTDAMYTASAKLTRWIADKHGIPKTRSRIIGHVEVDPACNKNRHTDPGPNWNWTKYMNLVNGTAPSPTTGVLIGVIYKDPNTNDRISGATVKVTVGGTQQSVTTDSTGVYQFNVPPGTYTISASAPNYTSASVTRTVVGGDTVWGSMGLKPAAPANGTLRGKIWLVEPGKDAASGTAISGVTVKLSTGASVTTAADGNYIFNVPPGTYTVTASKAGYQNGSVTRTVTAGTTTWGSIGLELEKAVDDKAPVVEIDSPAIDAPLAQRTFGIAQVIVTGAATDETSTIAAVEVFVNGSSKGSHPVSNGRFQAEVKLEAGQNSVELRASDAAGNIGKAAVTLFFDSGVDGFVYLSEAESEDTSTRVSGAAVILLDDTGAKVGEATTGVSGEFAISAVPGEYVIRVDAEGFISHQETITIGKDARAMVSLPLVEGTLADPELTFISPVDGSTVQHATITVSGNVAGFLPEKVEVNGKLASIEAHGAFWIELTLNEGLNVIEAVASGQDGEEVRASVQVTYVRPPTDPTDPTDPTNPGAPPGGVEAPEGACGCQSAGSAASPLLILAPALLALRRRERKLAA